MKQLASNPNVRAAINTIEKARTTSHSLERHQHGIAWSRIFASGMGVDLQRYDFQAVGAGERLGILNVLYEDAINGERARNITGQLIEALDPARAMAILNESLRDENDNLGAARNQLAFITSSGNQRLREMGKYDLAASWTENWESSVLGLCQAEYARTEFRLGEKSTANLEGIDNLTAGINKYLEYFSRTGAVELSFMGNFPFVEEPTMEKLEETKVLAEILTPIMRLMQDVKLDMNENLNTGFFAYAALNKLAIKEAKFVLTRSVSLQETVRDELKARLEELIAQTLPNAEDVSDYSANIIRMIGVLYEQLAS